MANNNRVLISCSEPIAGSDYSRRREVVTNFIHSRIDAPVITFLQPDSAAPVGTPGIVRQELVPHVKAHRGTYAMILLMGCNNLTWLFPGNGFARHLEVAAVRDALAPGGILAVFEATRDRGFGPTYWGDKFDLMVGRVHPETDREERDVLRIFHRYFRPSVFQGHKVYLPLASHLDRSLSPRSRRELENRAMRVLQHRTRLRRRR